MGSYALKAEVREGAGKELARKLRTKGQIPAVVYGFGGEPVSLTLNARDTELVLNRIHGEKVLVDLEYGGKQEKVFVRNVQRDPVLDSLMHADFYRVDLSREIDTTVPVISVGIPLGVKEGGLLEHGIREVKIRCLPLKVPPHLEVNVESLEIGDSIHARELAAIDGVRVLSPPEAVIFAVVAKAKEEEVMAATAVVPGAEGAVPAVPGAAPAAAGAAPAAAAGKAPAPAAGGKAPAAAAPAAGKGAPGKK